MAAEVFFKPLINIGVSFLQNGDFDFFLFFPKLVKVVDGFSFITVGLTNFMKN
jgi:hypothetical protein